MITPSFTRLFFGFGGGFPFSESSNPQTFFPTGMIPEFYALGKHPHNIFSFLNTEFRDAFTGLGLGDHMPGLIADGFTAAEELQQRASEFQAHHIPTNYQRDFSLRCIGALVDFGKCRLFGAQNFAEALRLTHEGHNVLIVQNHTSALDTYMSFAALIQHFNESLPLVYLMSQVFEYVPLTALMTAGGEKFKIFQEKHIDHMLAIGQKTAAAEMRRQNLATLRALRAHCQPGGKMVMFYPEKNRSMTMGPPEPRYLKMLSSLKPKDPKMKLYVLPCNTTGRNPVIANAPGTAELDTLLSRLAIGHADMYCYEPVPMDMIESVVDDIDQRTILSQILGTNETSDEALRNTTLGVALCSMIASVSGQDMGIYSNEVAVRLATRCMGIV